MKNGVIDYMMKCLFILLYDCFKFINYLKFKIKIIYRFYPIDKSMYKKPYEPLMLTKSKYGALDYGTKHFRDEPDPSLVMGDVRIILFN